MYFMYVCSTIGTAGCISQLNKQEVQITYYSHNNSKYLKLHKSVAMCMQEMQTLA